MWHLGMAFLISAGSCTRGAQPTPWRGTAAGLYARHAVALNSGTVRSPDGRKSVTIRSVLDPKEPDGLGLVFTISVDNKKFSEELAGSNAEVLWSPDSAAFGVTQTEGGGGIGYRVYLFFVGVGGIRKVAVSPPIEKVFRQPGKCEIPVPPNTALVSWLGGSERILIAAEVVPVSICECMGVFRLYEVTVPDLRIVRSYSQREAKQKYSHFLGRELMHAPETCVGPKVQQ